MNPLWLSFVICFSSKTLESYQTSLSSFFNLASKSPEQIFPLVNAGIWERVFFLSFFEIWTTMIIKTMKNSISICKPLYTEATHTLFLIPTLHLSYLRFPYIKEASGSDFFITISWLLQAQPFYFSSSTETDLTWATTAQAFQTYKFYRHYSALTRSLHLYLS